MLGKKREEPKTYSGVHNPNYPEEADVSFGETISFNQLPPAIIRDLSLRPLPLFEKDIEDVERITHGPNDVTYIMRRRERPHVTDATSEKDQTYSQTTYFMDYVNGEIAGYLNVRRSELPDTWGLVATPYVVDTATYTKEDIDYKHKGLNGRRLDMANAYCMKIYGQPLHSGTHFESPHAEKAWTTLYDEGRAEVAMEHPEHGKRYRYKV